MMTPKILPLLERCIEDGLTRGWNRAHKHTDEPSEERILEEQFNAIMGEIWEWFDIVDTQQGE